MLRKLINVGTLTVIDANGSCHEFKGEQDGPTATMRFHNNQIQLAILLNPSLALGEGFMKGHWSLEGGDLYNFLDLIGRNIDVTGAPVFSKFLRMLLHPVRHFQQYNPTHRARQNVRHHYDLSGELYDLFLDKDRQYSCAYYIDEFDPLEIAQENKKRHIAAKMRLEPGMKVLDIGSGWGGTALHLAQRYDVDVTGLTLSTEQHALSQRRAAEAGLSDRVRFQLCDYREHHGQYDRIVSVGMFEHVGIGHYREYFDKVSSFLSEDGVALLHTIGRMEVPGTTDPWIRKYIFPGGYLPALSEITAATEKAELWVADVEILRLHYAFTLRDWRERFMANRDAALALYDEPFCRMWEYYLAICEISFRYLNNTVFQVQLCRQQDAVPLTRHYMAGNDYLRLDKQGDETRKPTSQKTGKDDSRAA